MAKVAIKIKISLFLVEFFTSWTFFQSWALKNLPNLYWANVEVAAKHSAMEVFSALSSLATFVEGIALRTSMRLQGSSGRDLTRYYLVPTLWGAD